MWVRLSEWMIYDGGPPMPQVGTVLTGMGLRVRGELTPASGDVPDGIVEVPSDEPRGVMYQVTGRIEEPRDFDTDTGRGATHGGVEFVVQVGSHRYQVQSEGWASDVRAASRVTVRGRFEVVGAYEWEDFGLDDTRSTWLVQAMASAEDGDVMLDVVAPSGG